MAPAQRIMTVYHQGPSLNPIQKTGYYAILLFLFILYGRFFDFFLSHFHIPLVVSLTAQAAALLSGNLWKSLTSRTSLCFLGLTMWMCLCIPFSVWRGGSVGTLVDQWLKSLLVYFILVCVITTSSHAIRAIRVTAYGLLLLMIFAVTLGVYMAGRLTLPVGHYANPNELGFAMLLSFVFWWFISNNRRHSVVFRVFATACMLMSIYVLSQTGSRGALVGLLVAAVMFFFHYSPSGRAMLMAFAIAALLAAPFIVPPHILRRYTTFFSQRADVASEEDQTMDEFATGSANQRWYLLKSSIKMTLENPLFGVGPGMFMVAQSDDAREAGKVASWRGTHNTYAQLSSETGIPGLLLWLGAMFFCWRELRTVRLLNKMGRHPRKEELELVCYTLVATLFCFSVLFMFAHLAYSTVFPTIAGIVMALSQTIRAELQSIPPSPVRSPRFAPVAVRPASLPPFRLTS